MVPASHGSIVPVFEHLLEFAAVHADVRIEHLVAAAFANEPFQCSRGPHLVVRSRLEAGRKAVDAQIHIHLALLSGRGIAQEAFMGAVVEQPHRTDPQRVDAEQLVAQADRVGQMSDRHQNVLGNPVLESLPAQFPGHGQLHQGNFRRAHPGPQMAVARRVGKAHEILELKEDRRRMTVVVMAGRDVFAEGSAVQAPGRMGMEPGLVVVVDAVDPGTGRRGGKLALENDSGVVGKNQRLNETGRIVRAQEPVQPLAQGGHGIAGFVVEPDMGPDAGDAKLDRDQKSQGPVGPRQGVKKTRMFITRAADQLAVGRDELERLDRLEQKALAVAGGLDAHPHAQPAQREIVHFRLDGQREPPGIQVTGDLAHGHHRLRPDHATPLVHLQNIAQVHVNPDHVPLEIRTAQRHRLPRLAGGAHALAAVVTGPNLIPDDPYRLCMPGTGIAKVAVNPVADAPHGTVCKAGRNGKCRNHEFTVVGQEPFQRS